MSERFKLTGSEVNEVILNSPYSLADSPAALGQKSSQTKRYFYQFIKTLAEKINLHLGEIVGALDEATLEIDEAYQRIAELGEAAALALGEHNENENAHAFIRQKIIDEKNIHNKSLIAHEDIREAIRELGEELEVATILAQGKNRVMSFGDEMELFEYAVTTAKVGDILLLEDPSQPDFTVFGKGVSEKEGDIVLGIEDIMSGTELLPNKKYFVAGVRLVSSEGRLESSIFAKNEEFVALRQLVFSVLDGQDARIYALESEIRNKEDTVSKHTLTGESVILKTKNEYHLSTVSSLKIDVEDEDFFEAILCFKTGNGEISVDAPAELLFVGDDTLEGRFYPISKRLYEISVKRASGVLLARVGSVDYEVIM
ncbi:MAG: hypothetical protein IJC80_05045 [Clostridia bacterium]|nr:hypothetical protein [Clostridia bacterium]